MRQHGHCPVIHNRASLDRSEEEEQLQKAGGLNCRPCQETKTGGEKETERVRERERRSVFLTERVPCAVLAACPSQSARCPTPVPVKTESISTAAMAMAATSRASLSLLSLNLSSSSSSVSSLAQSRRSPSMAASRSSHVGGSRDLVSVKQRLSSSSSVKTGAPRVSATRTANVSPVSAVSPSSSSPGATSQGELIGFSQCRVCCCRSFFCCGIVD